MSKVGRPKFDFHSGGRLPAAGGSSSRATSMSSATRSRTTNRRLLAHLRRPRRRSSGPRSTSYERSRGCCSSSRGWPRARRARARFYARAWSWRLCYARPARGIIVWRRAATRGCRCPTPSTSRKTSRRRPLYGRRTSRSSAAATTSGRRTPPRRGARGRSGRGLTCSAALMHGLHAHPPRACRRSATCMSLCSGVGRSYGLILSKIPHRILPEPKGEFLPKLRRVDIRQHRHDLHGRVRPRRHLRIS